MGSSVFPPSNAAVAKAVVLLFENDRVSCTTSRPTEWEHKLQNAKGTNFHYVKIWILFLKEVHFVSEVGSLTLYCLKTQFLQSGEGPTFQDFIDYICIWRQFKEFNSASIFVRVSGFCLFAQTPNFILKCNSLIKNRGEKKPKQPYLAILPQGLTYLFFCPDDQSTILGMCSLKPPFGLMDIFFLNFYESSNMKCWAWVCNEPDSEVESKSPSVNILSSP